MVKFLSLHLSAIELNVVLELLFLSHLEDLELWGETLTICNDFSWMWSNLRVFHIGTNGHLSLAQVQKCGIVIDHCTGSGIGLIFWFAGTGQLWMERERETQFGSQCGRIHTQVQPGMSYRSSHSSISYTCQIITLMKVTGEPNLLTW